MRAIIKKLLREFWVAKGKFILCVLAAAVSGWGISSVTYSYLMTERDFHENFDATVPAHFSITVDGYTEAVKERIARHESVETVERREMLGGRIKNNKDVWMSLVVFGVEDLNALKLDQFKITDRIASEKHFILIEQNATDFLEYASDTAVLQFPGSTETVKVAKGGVVHDARMAPAQMEQVVYSYTLITELDSLLPAGKARLLIKTRNTEATREAYQEVANRITELVKAQGASVTEVVIPNPGEHMHQPIIDGIAFLQKSFGAILTILGITLLSLILLTWLLPQLIQVGVIKALGASTRQIYVGYLIVLLLIIAVGLSIGLPLGFKSAALFNKFIAFLQNFTVIDEPFPIYTHGLVMLTASVLPFLFGMMHIRRIARITVREALSTTFHSSSSGLIKYFQTIIHTAKLRYGMSNLFRSGIRTALLVALLSAGIALFFTGSNLSYSFRTDFESYYRASRYAITIGMTDTTSNRLAFLNQLPSVESVAYLRTLRRSYTVPLTNKIKSTTIKQYPPDYDMNPSLVTEGRIDKTCADCIFIHPAMRAAEFGSIQFGDTISVTDKEGNVTKYRYSGVIRDMGGAHGGGSMYRFMTEQNKAFGQVAIRLKAGVPIPGALLEIEKALGENNIKYSGISNVETLLEGAFNHFKPTYYLVQGLGLFTVTVAFLGMLIVLNLTIQERTLEIGIMKALGSSSKDIANLLQMEFTMITSVSILLGFALSIFFTGTLCELYGEMVRGQRIPPLNNYTVILITISLLMLAQLILIINYGNKRIQRTSNALLNHIT
ncbi:MAG: ABC transporter permease [Cyclobacteriaceae bacterium]|nr:ABC transporter permease [Cyclobacteriaceae bacterium]